MKSALLLRALIAIVCLTPLLPSQAQSVIGWKVATGDFYNPTNWDSGVIPGVTDIATIDNSGTATIGADAGNRELGSVKLGSVQGGTESGHIIMNGGFLRIGETPGDPKVNIGEGTVLSTFIMNGGTIFFDGPDLSDIAGSTSGKGVNELDWEVGERGMGRFELHNDSIFRAADDLKISENAAGSGYCLIDGNAQLSVGSGIAISSGGQNEQVMIIGGNARVEAGNSMGAGSPLGHTDEGYLTLSIGGGRANLTVQDNATLNFRVLSSRQGITKFTVKNKGQVHIFDVLTGKGFIDNQTPPDRPEIVGGFNSTLSSGPDCDSTLILQDEAQMTVNASAGLGISAPRDGGSSQGGKAVMTVRDKASFRVEQYLALGSGTQAETSDGTLEVIGPDASVSIGGNLNMAVDPDGAVPTIDLTDDQGNPAPGKSTLRAVITAATHSPVRVQGTARITHGILQVKLDGYSPKKDDVFTLIQGGVIEGEFRSTDLSEAPLAGGLEWSVEYAADAVRLKVNAGLSNPEGAGLTPKTATIYINTPDTINNNRTESLGVAIAANGNAIIGWEDDGSDLSDLEAVWTMFDSSGNSITPATQITTIDPTFAGQTLTAKFLSYFRADGSAVSGRTSWGPKIHANLFGDGLGMGATSFDLGIEVTELAPIQFTTGGDNAGDFPSVQLISNSGQPIRIVSGTSDADAEPDGDIRIADWEFLANGNIVVVGESRQNDDLVSKFGGTTPFRHAVYRVLGSNGNEVKPYSLVSSSTDAQVEIWHGAAATKDGFAIRFAQGGRTMVRLFDNSGNPIGSNIDLGNLANEDAAAGGGRGDGTGFHGNGNDAYVVVNGSGTQVRLTVLNADGTLRYTRSAIDDVVVKTVGRTDAAIAPSGEVWVVFGGTIEGGPVDVNEADVSVVLGRMFDRSGNPMGPTFYVSEKEAPSTNPLRARNPRVAWRDNLVVVVWESLNSGQLVNGEPVNVVATRFFTPGAPGGGGEFNLTGITVAGNDVTITWTGGSGPFLVQGKMSLSESEWANIVTTPNRTVTIPLAGSTGFFRVMERATTSVSLFKSVLTGAAERPDPVDTPGTGVGRLSLEGDTLTYLVSYQNLKATASNSHIHGPAPVTAPAGVLFGLTPVPAYGTAGILAGSKVLTAAEKTALLDGQTYVNIHSGAHGSGEIRGQVLAVP